MYTETYEIAGVSFRICSLHREVQTLCRQYLSQKVPAHEVVACQADIDFEREKSRQEDLLEGIPVRSFSDAYLETLAVYRKMAAAALEDGLLLFHGSAVAVDGVGYLFTAASGTGKSTHTRLWRSLLGDRAVMINDDKPFLRFQGDRVLVCGTPWDGKHHLSTNRIVPLESICILQRGEENRIAEITPADALPMLLQQSYRPGDPGGLLKTMELVDRLTHCCRFYRLQCNMQPEAAVLSFETMKRKDTSK